MGIFKHKVLAFVGAVHLYQGSPIFAIVQRMLSSEEKIQLTDDVFMMSLFVVGFYADGEFSFVFLQRQEQLVE